MHTWFGGCGATRTLKRSRNPLTSKGLFGSKRPKPNFRWEIGKPVRKQLRCATRGGKGSFIYPQ